jgi:hypothetical protein
MVATEKHLSRQELIRAARSKDSSAFPHVDKCRECADAVHLIRAFDIAGSQHLSSAPDDLVKRVLKPVSNPDRKESALAKMASLVFDSWSEPLPIGVRGESLLKERRLRFEIDGIVFDLRAEQHTGKWVFVGLVTGQIPDASKVMLKVGKQKKHPDRTGVFHWESTRPPRAIAILLADSVSYTLPELSWRRTSPK